MAEIILGGLLHLHQYPRRNLRRRHFLVARLDPGIAVVVLDDFVGHEVDVFLHFRLVETAPDQPLDREQGVVRIGDRLALGRLADGDFTVFHEGDDGRRGPVAFAVFDHPGLTAFHDRHAGIGGAQVDADNIAHDCALLIQGIRLVEPCLPLNVGPSGRIFNGTTQRKRTKALNPPAEARPGRRSPWRGESAAR
jgi:hypothetical protein